MKPFLRWAGSKAQLLPILRKYWCNDYRRYVEPFCGSACLFFSIEPKTAVLSDLNEELMCTLKQVQVANDVVIECIRRIKTDQKSYYRVREVDPLSLSPNERAARFIYLNMLCFNGLYRTNHSGQFNVPYGSRRKKKKFDADLLKDAAHLLSHATLENSDFEAVVNDTRRGDFLYVDPPYATGSQRIFNDYGKKTFSGLDLDRLISALDRADRRGVHFVLSYADVPEIQSIRKRWPSVEVSARRNIAGFVGARRSVREIIATNRE